MEIEQNTSQTRFEETYTKISQLLSNLNQKKEKINVTQLTSLTKKIVFLLNKENLTSLLQKQKTTFTDQILNLLENPNTIIPPPQTEKEISLIILVSLFLFKNKNYEISRELLHSLLFERPHLFSHRMYLDSLNDYLFYKYLNSIELQNVFDKEKPRLYSLLKELQNSKKELLFCNLYTFMMRNLLFSRQLREMFLLMKNCFYPEQIHFVHYTKYLFYKGVFYGRMGKLHLAYKFIGEALRKAPEKRGKNYSKGLEKYLLFVKKHLIVLELLLNDTPSPKMFEEEPKLWQYKKLVKLVLNGYTEQFENLLTKEKTNFQNDLVYPLMKQMHSIVIRNGLKKLSLAYTKISSNDILKKIHISKEENFELNSFLTKSKEHIENFAIDQKNEIIEFVKTKEVYSDFKIREMLLSRVKHLNSLDEQVIKSLRYPEKREVVKKQEEDEDYDELDFNFDDEDDDYY